MNRAVRRICFVAVCGAVLAPPVSAADAGRESPFTVGVGARALALGGGFTSLADDATAVFYNPAGLARLTDREVSFMHMTLFEETRFNYAGFVYPNTALGSFGIAYLRLGTDDIVRRRDFVDVGRFDYATTQLLLSYGRTVATDLDVGASLKVLYQTVADFSDFGVGADLAAQARLYENLHGGLLLRDVIPPTTELDGVSETLPLSIVGGLSYRDVQISERVRGVATFDLEKIEGRSVKVHTGAEVVIDSDYAVRIGYDRDNLAFGGGIAYRGFKFDYAYKLVDYIDDSHRFSLSYLFGLPAAPAGEAEQPTVSATVADEEEKLRRFADALSRADRFYAAEQLDSALVYYRRALTYRDDESISERIDEIQQALESRRSDVIRREQAELQQAQRNADYYFQAEAFLEKGNYDAARDMVDLIRQADPDYPRIGELRGRIDDAIAAEIATHLAAAAQAEQQGDLIATLAACDKVLALDSTHVAAQQRKRAALKQFKVAETLNRGIQLYKQGEYAQARQFFSGVLAVDPDEPVATEYINRIDRALARPATLEEMQQDEEIWQLYLEGLRHMREKEYQKAIDAWEKVLQAYPNNPNTIENLKQARLRLQSESGD